MGDDPEIFFEFVDGGYTLSEVRQRSDLIALVLGALLPDGKGVQLLADARAAADAAHAQALADGKNAHHAWVAALQAARMVFDEVAITLADEVSGRGE